jgi:hypothetical protein
MSLVPNAELLPHPFWSISVASEYGVSEIFTNPDIPRPPEDYKDYRRHLEKHRLLSWAGQMGHNFHYSNTVTKT